MSQEEQPPREITDVDDQILRDLQSKHASVVCPLHGERPRFDVDGKGSVVESFCCDTLLQIFRELGAGDRA